MKTVILGAAGSLGQELARQLPGAIAWDRSHGDITDAANLRHRLEAARPDVVYNCTSYNRVDAAESDPGPAFAINALAVRTMALTCRDLGCRLVHFSTNYIFGRDRVRDRPYTEDEPPAPPNVYGVSKLAGEEFVRDLCPRHLIIRTAALFGPARGVRHNFLENMLAKALAGETVRIVADQVVAPTLTSDLARAAQHLVALGAVGVYHVNGPEGVTWHDLARAFLDRAGLADRVRPVTTAELAAPAPRPRYSVMAIDKYLATGGPPPLSWTRAVDHYREARV